MSQESIELKRANSYFWSLNFNAKSNSCSIGHLKITSSSLFLTISPNGRSGRLERDFRKLHISRFLYFHKLIIIYS